MGELISIREILREIRQTRRQVRERKSLGRAVDILKDNLRHAVGELALASPPQRPELMDRTEKLVEMIRYGLRMLGEPHDEFDPSWLDPQ